MVITETVQPLATIPSISKLYPTYNQHASWQSLTTWSIFTIASRLWVTYGLLNRKPAIYVSNIIGLAMNLLMVNGILTSQTHRLSEVFISRSSANPRGTRGARRFSSAELVRARSLGARYVSPERLRKGRGARLCVWKPAIDRR